MGGGGELAPGLSVWVGTPPSESLSDPNHRRAVHRPLPRWLTARPTTQEKGCWFFFYRCQLFVFFGPGSWFTSALKKRRREVFVGFRPLLWFCFSYWRVTLSFRGTDRSSSLRPAGLDGTFAFSRFQTPREQTRRWLTGLDYASRCNELNVVDLLTQPVRLVLVPGDHVHGNRWRYELVYICTTHRRKVFLTFRSEGTFKKIFSPFVI